ncbi:uncharacterized protein LOC134296735 [Anolis carolinensis]|uniref:uncharacterized protein LOC134296735 n=1 Tax=Anolis carolinensis TaxID=28377 RepID=UPI002F2B76A2
MFFRFVWGTANFPLARVVTYRKTTQGGLNLPALRLKFLANYLSQNFGKFGQGIHQQDGLEGWLALIAKRWVNESWAEKGGGGGIDAFSGDMKHAGPDFLIEVYGQIQQNKVLAEWFQAERGVIKNLKQFVYWVMVGMVFFQPQMGKNARKEHLSSYLKETSEKIEYFMDRRIPFGLWYIQWRFYHQIHYLKGNQPWLKEEQVCPRLLCQKHACVTGSKPRETTEHFIRDCPSAKETWQKVAVAFDWLDLALQPWEVVASGLEPEAGIWGPRQYQGRKRKRGQQGDTREAFWDVPWSTTRLINLYVLLALVFQRSREITTQKPANVTSSVNWVAEKIGALSKTERGRMPSSRWKKFWPWLTEITPGIT